VGKHPDAASPLAHFPGGFGGAVRAATADTTNANNDDTNDETSDDRHPGPGA
jgi:hypothetical protein